MLEKSFQKAIDMASEGEKYVIDGPDVEERNVFWMIQSQTDASKLYHVSILPNLLMTYKNTRECYKNFSYKCSCEDFKVMCHSIGFNLL